MVKALNALTSIKENLKACCTEEDTLKVKKKRRKLQYLNILVEGSLGWVNNLFINSAISPRWIYLWLPQSKAAFCPMCPLQPGKTVSQSQEFGPTYLTHRLWMSHFLTINTNWSVEVSFSSGRLLRHGPFVGPSYRRKFHTLAVYYFFIDKNVKYGGQGNGLESVSFSLASQLQLGE